MVLQSLHLEGAEDQEKFKVSSVIRKFRATLSQTVATSILSYIGGSRPLWAQGSTVTVKDKWTKSTMWGIPSKKFCRNFLG